MSFCHVIKLDWQNKLLAESNFCLIYLLQRLQTEKVVTLFSKLEHICFTMALRYLFIWFIFYPSKHGNFCQFPFFPINYIIIKLFLYCSNHHLKYKIPGNQFITDKKTPIISNYVAPNIMLYFFYFEIKFIDWSN